MLTWSHTTRLVFLACSLIVLAQSAASASDDSVDLQWSPNSESDLAGYNIYHGTQSGVYGFPNNAGNTTQYQMNNIDKSKPNYFAITAYDSSGNESNPSPEARTAVEATTPPNLLVSPEPNTSLEGATVTFAWTPDELPVMSWWLNVGSSQGDYDLFDTGSLGSQLSATAHNLPTDGSPVWVRLWYQLASGWDFVDAEYTAANVKISTFPLAVKKNGNGSGSFTSNPIGQSCGNTCPGHTKQYPDGTNITFTANPHYDSLFVGWSGGGCSGTGPCTVTLTQATTVTATFDLAPFATYPLAVKKTGNGSGTFLSNPKGQSCGNSCPGHTKQYPDGTSITFTAKPADDSVFEGWSGGGCSGTGSCTINLTQPTTVTANFKLIQVAATAPAIMTPISGTTLPGGTATFTWESNGTTVGEWWLYVGTSKDGKNLYNRSIPSNTMSQTVSGLPTNGTDVWVKLWWLLESDGSWQSTDVRYSAATK